MSSSTNAQMRNCNWTGVAFRKFKRILKNRELFFPSAGVFNGCRRIFNYAISARLIRMAKKGAKIEEFLNMDYLCFFIDF